jgi:hypothetical protein
MIEERVFPPIEFPTAEIPRNDFERGQFVIFSARKTQVVIDE